MSCGGDSFTSWNYGSFFFPTHIITKKKKKIIYPKITVLLYSKATVLKYHLKNNIPDVGVQRPKDVYILNKICLFTLRKLIPLYVLQHCHIPISIVFWWSHDYLIRDGSLIFFVYSYPPVLHEDLTGYSSSDCVTSKQKVTQEDLQATSENIFTAMFVNQCSLH